MAWVRAIVAFAAGAVPETLGDAGLLLDVKDPCTVAAAVARVVRDAALRDRLPLLVELFLLGRDLFA